MHNPLVAIAAAAVAGWIFGAIWYGVLGQKMPLAPMIASFLAALVMSAVLYQLLSNLGVMGVAPSAIAGATIGIGFVGTTTLVSNMFQQKSLMLTVIDTGHWVLALVVEAVVLALLA